MSFYIYKLVQLLIPSNTKNWISWFILYKL